MLKNKNTRLAAVLLAGGLALGTYAVGTPSASAADAAGSVGTKASETYQNEATGECLWANGVSVFINDCNNQGSDYQSWSVTHWGDGTVRLRNVGEGTCLDAHLFPSMAECDASEVQSFYVDRWGDGTIRFRNEANGECLDANSRGQVYSASCDTSESQSWY